MLPTLGRDPACRRPVGVIKGTPSTQSRDRVFKHFAKCFTGLGL